MDLFLNLDWDFLLNKNMYNDIDEFLNCKSMLGVENLDELLDIFSKRYYIYFNHEDYKDITKLKKWIINHENKGVSPMFNYRQNNFGLRDNDIQLTTDMICIGCSISYGVGVPENLRWSNLVSKHLNLTFNNYSIPGLSSQEIVLILLSFLKFVKTKKILILLPDMFRSQMPFETPEGNITNVQIFDRFTVSPIEHQKKLSEMYYKLPTVYHLENFRLWINILLTCLSKEDVKLYLHSWSKKTLDFINKFCKQGKNVYLNRIQDYIPLDRKGLDLLHPGLVYHKKIADQFIELINKSE